MNMIQNPQNGKKKRISEIDCPKCGKYTLEVGSQLVKNDLNTTRWSSTKEGKLKNVGNIIDGPEYKKRMLLTITTESLAH